MAFAPLPLGPRSPGSQCVISDGGRVTGSGDMETERVHALLPTAGGAEAGRTEGGIGCPRLYSPNPSLLARLFGHRVRRTVSIPISLAFVRSPLPCAPTPSALSLSLCLTLSSLALPRAPLQQQPRPY